MSAKKKKAEARNERAAKAAALRREREKAEARRRNLITGGIVVVVLLIVAGTVWGIASQEDTSQGPEAATDDYGYLVDMDDLALPEGAPTLDEKEPVRVVVYEDFLCPACRSFEEDTGAYLKSQAAAGAITLEYRVLNFLDRFSTDDYSTRSANAAACVVDDAGVDAFVVFHDLLFGNQPPEGGPGLPDDQLIEYAYEAGASDEVDRCITDLSYEEWVDQAYEAASEADVTGTPTLFVAGERVTGPDDTVPDKSTVQAAIAQAQE